MRRSVQLLVLLLGIAMSGVCQIADVLVTKTGPTTAAVGANVTYSIGVQNLGPDPAANVVLADNIPGGMNFVSFTQNTGPGFACSAGAIVTCTLQAMASGASASFTLVAAIPVGTPAGTTFTNVATLVADNDPTDENNAAALAMSVPASFADVSISKSAPASALAGGNVTYAITVQNNGPNAATGVSLSDPLPGTMTLVSLSQSGPAFSCTTPSVGSGGTVVCTNTSFASGAVTTFNIVANIPGSASAGATFGNTAIVSSDFDPIPDNDSASASTTVSSVDITLVKAGPATATAGTAITYTITISSPGPSVAENVVLTDTLPSGSTFVSLTQASGLPFSCVTPPVGSPGTVNCGVSNFPAGVAAFSLVVHLGGAASVSNTASVSASTVDPNPANNSSTAVASVTPAADVSVSKTTASTAPAGSTLSYTITVANAGPSAATGVSITDTLPAGATFVSLTQNSGPSFTCTTGATVTCSIASMASGASASFSLLVNVGAVASLSNTASVTSSTTDPTPGNNSATATTVVTGSADVSVVKTGPATAALTGTASYTITVSNVGPSGASSVSLTDTLPANLTFASITQTSGPTFTCTTGAAVTCSVAALTSGSTAVFNLAANVTTGTGGSTFANTATVTSASSDPNPANNSSTTSPTTIAPTADLSVATTAASTVMPGQTITYTITVTNNGPSPASNVSLMEGVPLKTTFVSMTQASGASFSCANPSSGAATGTSMCTIVSLASGATAVFTYFVRVDNSTAVGATISNSATVASATADPVAANNTAATSVTVTVPSIPTISSLTGLLLAGMLAGIAARLIGSSNARRSPAVPA